MILSLPSLYSTASILKVIITEREPMRTSVTCAYWACKLENGRSILVSCKQCVGIYCRVAARGQKRKTLDSFCRRDYKKEVPWLSSSLTHFNTISCFFSQLSDNVEYPGGSFTSRYYIYDSKLFPCS
ncbi:unnamed protein product [Rotaria socialis]